MAIGGVAIQRQRRTPRHKRVPQLVAHHGTHCAGKVTCRRGAWIKPAGVDAERTWDANIRLARNIGDAIVVMHGLGVSFAIVDAVEVEGWRETWTVRAVAGDPIAEGEVTVMAARKARTR